MKNSKVFDERLLKANEVLLMMGITFPTMQKRIKTRAVILHPVRFTKYCVRYRLSEVIENMQLTEEEKEEKKGVLMQPIPGIIGTRKAASIVNCSMAYIQDLIKSGELKTVVSLGKTRINKKDLYDLIDRKTTID